ncbi:radical SAM domain-containing protein [Candidatus Magnetoovum chiemensis]|nr:radical SAM domain-containing protein [Candidatus Magnetoovum chiemensis]
MKGAAKEDILSELSKIDGINVSGNKTKTIKRRIITDLNTSQYPTNPVVPFTEVVHDRINIEITRGCTCGCRFCQAGMIYRPVRERNPVTALKLADQALANTGYDEVSFTSLNAGDYSELLTLSRLFNRKFKDKNISFSLPSLRVCSINDELLSEIKQVRRSGFTIAPEAATERLRSVINKNFADEDYDRTLYSIFKAGWLNLKLYFMIGLPTETDEDIENIILMAKKAFKTAKKYTKRSPNITVSVSTFVPKPHTPFQWGGQIPIEEIIRKKKFVKHAIDKSGMKCKSNDEYMSMLEAAISRGGQEMSKLLH